MHSMTKESMIEANGGYTYTYYKCRKCGYCTTTKLAMKLHIMFAHGGSGSSSYYAVVSA